MKREFDKSINGAVAKRQFTFDELNALLRCDPDQGKIFWLAPHRNAGKEALGSLDKFGYKRGAVSGVGLRAHRVIWLLHYGTWPSGEIDHIDGDVANNKISNLREVNRSENMRNRTRHSNNKSGCAGVVWHKFTKKWQVMVCNKYIGVYEDLDEAIAVRRSMEKEHGFTDRHGSKKP